MSGERGSVINQDSAGEVLGVIVVDHGSRVAASNRAFEAFVASFAERSGYAIVEPAHMELAEPDIGAAFDRCVARGATRVVVCPFFLLPGRHWNQDIPELTAEAATRHPGVSWLVSAPIGGHPLLIELLVDRVEHCRGRVAGERSACDVCVDREGCVRAGSVGAGPGAAMVEDRPGA